MNQPFSFPLAEMARAEADWHIQQQLDQLFIRARQPQPEADKPAEEEKQEEPKP